MKVYNQCIGINQILLMSLFVKSCNALFMVFKVTYYQDPYIANLLIINAKLIKKLSSLSTKMSTFLMQISQQSLFVKLYSVMDINRYVQLESPPIPSLNLTFGLNKINWGRL